MNASFALNFNGLISVARYLLATLALSWGVAAGGDGDPLVRISRDGNGVAINFIGVLQSANSISGPWVDEPGEPPMKVIPSQAARYYRVKPFELPAAAHFTVNLETGEVVVSPEVGLAAQPKLAKKGDPIAAVIFGGSTIGFNSSVVLTQAGDPGEKVLSVSLVNQSGRTVGQQPNGVVGGIKVIFSDFKNLSTPSDLRLQATVSTLAGTGAVGSGDGPALLATFNRPVGIAKGPDGSFYICAASAHKIRKLSEQQVFTLAGSGTAASVDGIGAAASINLPWAIAYSATANALVVAERNGRRIRLVTFDGHVTTVAGTGASGGNNGTGDVATFNDPTAIAVDGSGAIYVGEYPGQRIRKITLTGADPHLASSYTVSTWAGSGVAGSADGTGTSAQFKLIFGLAAGQDGTLYVADALNYKIRRISPAQEVITIAGTGTSGSLDGSGKIAQFKGPSGVALLNGTVVISDYIANTLRVLSLTPGGAAQNAADWQVRTLAGTGSPGATEGRGDAAQFNSPFALTPDGAGNLVVSDYANSKLRKVAPTAGYFPVGIPAPTTVTEPVQLSNAQDVYTFTTAAGQTLRPYISYNESLLPGATSAPQKWAFVVPAGVNAFEFSVTVVAPSDTQVPLPAISNPGPTGAGSPDVLVSTLAGSGAFGYVNGPAAGAQFSTFYGIAVDREGTLYVADTYNNAIRRISKDRIVTTVAGSLNPGGGSTDGRGDLAKFSVPVGIAVTPDGSTLYVTDFSNRTIRRIALYGGDPKLPGSWYVSTIAGSAAGGDFAFNTDGASARFIAPYGMAWAPGDMLIVTDSIRNTVLRLQPQGADLQLPGSWFVSLVAGDPTAGPGTTDANGSAARFNYPTFTAADQGGNIYVADASNNRIRKIDLRGNVSTLAGSSSGYADGIGAAAQFQGVYGLAIDNAGYLYASDYFNARVRRVSPAGVVTTVTGTFPVTDYDGTGDSVTIGNPLGLAIDNAGTLYAASSRIRMIQRILR